MGGMDRGLTFGMMHAHNIANNSGNETETGTGEEDG